MKIIRKIFSAIKKFFKDETPKKETFDHSEFDKHSKEQILRENIYHDSLNFHGDYEKERIMFENHAIAMTEEEIAESRNKIAAAGYKQPKKTSKPNVEVATCCYEGCGKVLKGLDIWYNEDHTKTYCAAHRLPENRGEKGKKIPTKYGIKYESGGRWYYYK